MNMKNRKVLESYTELEEIQRNTDAYLDYISKHIKYLRDTYDNEILPIRESNNISKYFTDDYYIYSVDKCYENILSHDISKRSQEEFDAYRKRFYPTEKEKSEKWDEIKKNFHTAWVHHYRNNPHHVEYWDGKDMELCYILELYCDWKSVSLLKGGNPYRFYQTCEERNLMSERTREVLEELFKILGYY